MHLPKQITPRKEPILIFVADSERAKWYLVREDDLEKKGSFIRPKPEFRDRESQFKMKTGDDAVRSGSSTLDNVFMHEENIFCKETAKQLERAAETTQAKHIYFSCPRYLKRQIDKHLSQSVRSKIKNWHDGNLYRFSGMSIAMKLLG